MSTLYKAYTVDIFNTQDNEPRNHYQSDASTSLYISELIHKTSNLHSHTHRVAQERCYHRKSTDMLVTKHIWHGNAYIKLEKYVTGQRKVVHLLDHSKTAKTRVE